jgi:hypothetical protein
MANYDKSKRADGAHVGIGRAGIRRSAGWEIKAIADD